jgi:hypothetical protein
MRHEDAATVAPRGFSHAVCRECATDVHDEHFGQRTCSVDGCTCEEGGDDLS